MASMPVLIAIGPCLMLAMAALALTVVNMGLGRTSHALLWAGGCAAGALQWGVLALEWGRAGRPLQWGLPVHLLGVAAAVLLAEGFRVRRGAAGGRPVLFALGGCAAFALVATVGMPDFPVRALVTPLLWIALLLWAADLVVTPGTRPSLTETTVIAVLFGIVLIHLCGAALALAGLLGLLDGHETSSAVYLAAAEPASAAVTLAALMLIAHDYARELQRMLHTDPLTGVLNREGLAHAARLAFNRARARQIAVGVADIDHFKQVNDVHGHAVGDAALTEVAGLLADELGRDGTVARIGGEEFAILLPGKTASEGLACAERLRRRVAERRIAGDPGLHVTMSFGVAERASGETLAPVMERADAALYQSKRDGRDRCTLAPAPTGA